MATLILSLSLLMAVVDMVVVVVVIVGGTVLEDHWRRLGVGTGQVLLPSVL